MKKVGLLLGARTPVLAIITAFLFFLIIWLSASNYYVDKLTVLDVQIERYDDNKKEIVFSYDNKLKKIEVGTKIYYRYSKQSSLQEGTILKMVDDAFLASIDHKSSIDPSVILKSEVIIKDGKEPIIRRLL